MATYVENSAGQHSHQGYENIPKRQTVFMKFFRPDQDQVSMFRLREINACQVCHDECGIERIVAQPGCCKCLVHLDCFNDLAAHPNSALTFTCPRCEKELSGESVRAARHQTCLLSTNDTGDVEDSEMLLGSIAIKNISARRTTHRRQVSEGEGAVHHRQGILGSSSECPGSTHSARGSAPLSEAVSKRTSESSQELGIDGLKVTFFIPYHVLEKELAAERNKASRSQDFLSWLLPMNAGRSSKQSTPLEHHQDHETQMSTCRY